MFFLVKFLTHPVPETNLDIFLSLLYNIILYGFPIMGISILFFVGIEYRNYSKNKKRVNVTKNASFKTFLSKKFKEKAKNGNFSNQISEETFKLLEEIEKENTKE